MKQNLSIPSKVRAEHLNREALVYVRQSTMTQVRFNQESTQRQYALQERALSLGWPEEHIRVIDGDLGISGSGRSKRPGFAQLVTSVSLGEVGAVFGLEISRLARSSADLMKLLELCGLFGTLVIDEDGIYDMSDFNDRLLIGLKGTMGEAELHFLHARMIGGKENAASRVNCAFHCLSATPMTPMAKPSWSLMKKCSMRSPHCSRHSVLPEAPTVLSGISRKTIFPSPNALMEVRGMERSPGER